jgi:Cu-Zn family superoxide dismutase
MKLRFTAMAVVAASALLVACAQEKRAIPKVIAGAHLASKSGSEASGTIEFIQNPDHVLATVKVNRLGADTVHGFHIHEKGDCSAADGMSAGGHFNPTGAAHGPQHGEKHAGDMPALVADASGYASTSFKLTGVTLTEGPNSILGRSVIVHKDPDDYKTQPTGNSGARIACGVIAIP